MSEVDTGNGARSSPVAVVVMGVAGAGKSTLAAALAARLGAEFIEADDLHSAEAMAQMAAGVPLTDDDRWPWLTRVATLVRDEGRTGPVVVACSALRRVYRDVLIRVSGLDLAFVHVHGTDEELAARIGQRTGHFMPASMLASQLATLEPLASEENGIVVPLAMPIEGAAEVALEFLRQVK
ncbi:gluconokinase, GntK/IdnK-type [Microbacterium sp. PRC9]|uniref:gluconokinase n=1 Tax=Microbacterium sp. PRC9 TaxID=2962591 RepID=UPI002881FFA0|nr:gluconokinase, GntK/IdnK-type [Microbacterium sp. PRC9]MDT0143932.1 gluconokinase, GntK/IdnK-type [Microbacterium sp. PRC9]